MVRLLVKHKDAFDVFKILLEHVVYLTGPQLCFPKGLPLLQLEIGLDLFEYKVAEGVLERLELACFNVLELADAD